MNRMHICFIPGVRIFKAQTEEKTPSVCALKMKQAMHTINGAPLVNLPVQQKAEIDVRIDLGANQYVLRIG